MTKNTQPSHAASRCYHRFQASVEVTARTSTPSLLHYKPVTALEAVIENRCLVLLGAPGSGKSTFIRHVAFSLAQQQLDPAGDRTAMLPGWPEDEADLLPVVVALREFVRWASDQEDEARRTFNHYLRDRLTRWELEDYDDPLRDALHAGKAIILFDGLDEVPDAANRTFVRDAVRTFATTYQGVRMVITCRTLAYQDPDWQLPDDEFPAFELEPFTEDKVAHFIRAWYREQFDLGAIGRSEVQPRIAQLTAAVQRPELAALASNPLLLTVMALIHTHERRLPEVRALLYEACIDVLLWQWEETKPETSGLRALLAEADLQEIDLKRALWALAFELYQGPGRDGGDLADITDADLWKALRPLHPDHDLHWTARIATHIQVRSRLLVAREPGVYAFPHRTFQEYLAGSYLSVQENLVQQALDLAAEADFWREVILLAVSRQVHVSGSLSDVLVLIGELCPQACVDDEAHWRRAWLAGEVLLEMGLNRARQSQSGRDLLARMRQRLSALVEGGHLQARERAEVGDVLGRLGDPRFDPDVHYLPQRYRGEPEPALGFVKVPAGPFVMGEGYGEHQRDLPYDAWFARYPVTVAQYGAFIVGGGYDASDYWSDAGWAWRQGEWNSQVPDPRLQKKLEARTAALRGAPLGWAAQERCPTRPVVGVTWFEAVAYVRWLETQLRDGAWAGLAGLPDPCAVRLLSEAEWEKAARAGEKRRYAWGEAYWDEGRANIGKSGLGHPTPVGMYPRGANAWGLHEMAGNVWEWTRSLDAPYPYAAGDGREKPDAEGRRILRGGSWHDPLRNARGAARVRRFPDQFDWDLGFRVVATAAEIEPDNGT